MKVYNKKNARNYHRPFTYGAASPRRYTYARFSANRISFAFFLEIELELELELELNFNLYLLPWITSIPSLDNTTGT